MSSKSKTNPEVAKLPPKEQKKSKKSARVERPSGPCERAGCTNIVPASLVRKSSKHRYCSVECSRRGSDNIPVKCGFCGKFTFIPPWRMKEVNFCSLEHHRAYRLEMLLAPTGPFRPVIEKYLADNKDRYAKGTFKSVQGALTGCLAYAYQTEQITSLEQITPQVISRYILHEVGRGIKNRNYIGYLSVFFDRLRAEGLMERGNPVVPHYHNQSNNKCAPRPYSNSEIETLWKVLEASGEIALMLAFRIGLECGMRVSEVANIRTEDVDQVRESIHVRLPTKNGCERDVHYRDGVKKCLALWLKVRSTKFAKDYLLHGGRLGAFDTSSLDSKFKTVLESHPAPASTFSFHRLRHTWASRLANNGMGLPALQALGGWKSLSSLQKYLKVLDSTIQREYEASYRKLQEQDQAEIEETLSLVDFALIKSCPITHQQQSNQ
jgi:integrase